MIERPSCKSPFLSIYFYLHAEEDQCCMLTQIQRQYSYDASMTLDGSSAPWNRVISNLDKTFAMRLYPKEGIQRTTTDGVYFINRERNGFEASGIAYYSHFGNNDGQKPDEYVEVSNGSFAWWENGGEGTLLLILTLMLFLATPFIPFFFILFVCREPEFILNLTMPDCEWAGYLSYYEITHADDT